MALAIERLAMYTPYTALKATKTGVVVTLAVTVSSIKHAAATQATKTGGVPTSAVIEPNIESAAALQAAITAAQPDEHISLGVGTE